MRNFAAVPVCLPENKGRDPKDENDPPESPEVHGAPREVPLGLEGEEGQGQTQGGRYGHGHPNPLSLVENCKKRILKIIFVYNTREVASNQILGGEMD